MTKLVIQLVSPTGGGELEDVRVLHTTTVETFVASFGGLPSRFDTLQLSPERDRAAPKKYCHVRRDFDLMHRCLTLKVIDPDETSTSGYPTIR